MRTVVGSWRVALRIARREAARAKGRSALILAMMTIPVLGLTFAAVSWDMFTLTPDEKADRTMGAADARVTWSYANPVEQDPSGEWVLTLGGGPATGQPGPDLSDSSKVRESLAGLLPAGTRVIPLRRGEVPVRTVDGLGRITAIAVDSADPLARGLLAVVAGRAPRGPGEVALTHEAMTRIGTAIGRTTAIGGDSRAYTVVGQVEFAASLAEFAVFAPDDPLGAGLGDPSFLADTPQPVTWADVRELNRSGIVVVSRAVLRDPPPTPAYAMVSERFTDQQVSLAVVVVGIGVLEIILLAGSAFAVGARRRQRQLALVGANGGTPQQIRRIVLADGIVLGTVGAVVGLAVGLPAALLARPLVEEYVWHARAGGYRFFPTALAAIGAITVATGVLAATAPAFLAARQDVVASLSGRRGLPRTRKRWWVLGLVMTAAGTAGAAYGAFAVNPSMLVAGFIVGELGLVLCTPALVGLLGRMGGGLPVPLRVSLRDTARNRAAAAPAISAVMAVVASTVALGLYENSARAMSVASYWPVLPNGTVTVYIRADTSEPGGKERVARDRDLVVAALRDTLPRAHVLDLPVTGCATTDPSTGAGLDPSGAGLTNCRLDPVMPRERACPYLDQLRSLLAEPAVMRAAARDPRCDSGWPDVTNGFRLGGTPVDDGTQLAALTGAAPEEAARAAAVLRAGGVVVRDARYIVDGEATFEAFDRDGDPLNSAAAPRLTFPAYLLTTGVPGGGPIISPLAAARARVQTMRTGLFAVTSPPPTLAEEDLLNLRMDEIGAIANVERAPEPTQDPRLLVLTVAAALIALGATAVATGLAAADGRADLGTLAAVGASPRMRRALSLSQSGVIAGLGSVLGAAAGLGAAVAIVMALNKRYDEVWPAPPLMPIAMPWSILALAVLGVPAVAMLGAGVFTRSRLPIERRAS